MKVYRLAAAGLALGLLTGCASLLERSYTTSEPHSSKFWESEAAATLRAENRQDMVNDLLSNQADGLPPVSLSVGVAFSDRQDPGESIFKDADHALYHVKQHGKHGCGFYGAEQEPCAEPDAAVPMSETE